MAKKPNGVTRSYTILSEGRVIHEGHGNNYSSMLAAVEPIFKKEVVVQVVAEDRQTAFNVSSALRLHRQHTRWSQLFLEGWRSHQNRTDDSTFVIRWTRPKKVLKKKPEIRTPVTFEVTETEKAFLQMSLQGLRSM